MRQIDRKLSACSGNYDGKTVEFLCEQDGKLLLLTGRFVARITRGGERLEIHFTGRLEASDSPDTSYIFQVLQPHLRSLVPATRRSADADFFMEKPLNASTLVSRFPANRSVLTPICV
jgi:hypothetical protein